VGELAKGAGIATPHGDLLSLRGYDIVYYSHKSYQDIPKDTSYPSSAMLSANPSAPVPAVGYLVRAQCRLKRDANEARDADTSTVAHTCGAETELPILHRHLLQNLGETIDVDSTAQKSLPKDNDEDDVDRGNEEVHGMKRKEE
jgi:hypothetical protein